ncbi:hypothetical protein M8J77_025450 [Diaphorina citri]|nr:hypothetical protein M8J77_025450 [Diaphorina citri]
MARHLRFPLRWRSDPSCRAARPGSAAELCGRCLLLPMYSYEVLSEPSCRVALPGSLLLGSAAHMARPGSSAALPGRAARQLGSERHL